MLPGWITTIALAVLLTFITDNLYKRAITMQQREREAREAMEDSFKNDLSDPDDKSDGLIEPLLEGELPVPSALLEPAASSSGGEGNSSEYVAPPSAPRTVRLLPPIPRIPFAKVSVLVLLLACVITSNFVKHIFTCPSLSYWLSATSIIPVTIPILIITRKYLLKRSAVHAARGLPLEDLDDVHWTNKSTLLYPTICTFAGVFAGMFGVGGGIVKGPLMLAMGVPPEVAVATSATMILFTSMSASVIFISFGALPTDYGVLLFFVGAIFTATGHLLTSFLQKHLQTKSLIVWIMAFTMGLSSLVLAIQGGMAVKHAIDEHSLWNWGNICGANASPE